MTSTDPTLLLQRARRSYELGRARAGINSALKAVPAVGLSVFISNASVLSLVVGLALLLLTLTLRWLGQAYGRAIVPGFLAGSAPLVLPLLLRGTGHCCIGGVCWSVCMLGCVAGGLAAGASIGWASAREREQRWAFLGAATLLASLLGTLGCAAVGVAGTLGMLLAVMVSLPLGLVVQARAW
jgi:hypothetical protein